MIRAASAVLLAFCAACPTPAQTGPEPAIDAYVGHAVREWGEPGLAIAVVRDGRIAFEKGYGLRGAPGSEAVGPATLFQIGSLTKAFTAAALAMLVDEGKLTWDTRVIDALPGFRMYDSWVTREIRVRDLLCHRSGLPPFAGDMMAFGSTLDRAELVRRIRYFKPASSFRSRFAYSNLMFVAAGAVVERASGESWDRFVASRIFSPLGMASTTTDSAALDANPNAARPWALIDGSNRLAARRIANNIAPAGGIASSAHDMARWMLLQLAGGTSGGRRLFSEAAARAMWTVETPIATRPEPDGWEPMFHGYGLGWNLSEYRGRKIVYHGGALQGMTSLLMLVPSERLGVVVLTNAELPLQRPLARRVIDAYLGAPERDWSGEALRRFRDDERRDAAEGAGPAPAPASAIAAASCAGVYESDALGAMDVKAVGARLEVSLPVLPRATGAAEPWRLATWRVTWNDPTLPKTFLWFDVDPDGNVTAARLRPSSGDDDSFDVADYEFTRRKP